MPKIAISKLKIKAGHDVQKPAAAPVQNPKGKTYFSAAELAQRWGISERHVRRLMDSGGLVTHHFGRSVRVSQADVLIYEACSKQVV